MSRARPGASVTGTPALEARSVTKHFPVHRRGRRTRRGSVVHAVDGVSLTVPDAGISRSSARAAAASRR